MGQDPGTGSEAVTTAKEPEQVPAKEPEQVAAKEPEQVQAKDPEQLEREIEETRAQLGDTVEALTQKTDVKAQAKRKVQDTKAAMSAKTEQLKGRAKQASPDSTSQAAAQVSRTARDNPLTLAALGAFAAGFLAGRMTKD